MLSFAASPVGVPMGWLLFLSYWKPTPGTNCTDDLVVTRAALDDSTYSPEEAHVNWVKALGDKFDI